jgi:predicted nuclease of predicted toxin-antitoxin system
VKLSERLERALLQYFSGDAEDEREFQSLSSIHLGFEPPAEWLGYHWSDVEAVDDKENLKAILDQMVMDDLLQRDWADDEIEPSYRLTEHGSYEAIFGMEGYIPAEPAIEPIRVDTSTWTGLGKNVSPANLQIIKDKAKALQVAIMQSDADFETKTDACKRVEAAIVLLEAPNVPWKEVVSLLNHPTVTAFLAAISLIQFIIGLAA